MAVDLSDLLDSVKREVSAPGLTQLPNATDADYLGNLQDGFWETVLDGLISGYTESDGIVNPVSGDTDLPRDLQQLVVFYAGFRIVRNQLRDLKSTFRTKAGPVEYETQQAASVLVRILDDLKSKKSIILDRLSDTYSTNTVYIDALRARDEAMTDNLVDWITF